MTLERLIVPLEHDTLAELRRDALVRGISPAELAREAIEAFVDVERAVVLDPSELRDEEPEDDLFEDDWTGLERELPTLTDAEYQ